MALSKNKKVELEQFPEQVLVHNILDKKFKVRLYGPRSLDDQLAVITHYFHNINTPEEKSYKGDAIEGIKQIIEFNIFQ